MDPNGTNILGKAASTLFSSNYLWKCLFPLTTIIKLLILITDKLWTRCNFASSSTIAFYRAKSPFSSLIVWPTIHQTFESKSPETLFNVNLREPVDDASVEIDKCTSSISLPIQSQNTTEATATVSLQPAFVQRFTEFIKQYQEQVESGGCGLVNLGHSCYINSALQCLCHIRPFIDIILNLQEQQQYQLPLITPVYARLLTEMQLIPKGSTTAHELKARISDVNQRFAGTDEQDSHEFLTVLLEALHNELIDHSQDLSIGDLMHGIITSTVRCLECGEETKTDDSYLSLPLLVRRSNGTMFSSFATQNIFWPSINLFGFSFEKNVTLYDCFKDFLSMEQLGENGQWFCEKCQQLTDAKKRFNLGQLPRVLFLQLKRFTCDLTNDTKITTKIRSELILDLKNFINEHAKDQSSLYDLVAVITHSGTLASGHYTTFAKHLDNCCWYHFDDQHVRQASLNEVLISDAYVLVYERKYIRPSS